MASKTLQAPVISGNVSFYNESMGENITSTPAIGIVGIRDNVHTIPQDRFTSENSSLYLLSLALVQKVNSEGFLGQINTEKVKALVEVLISLAHSEFVTATRVVGLGGRGISILKMSLNSGLGFKTELDGLSPDSWMEENFYEILIEVQKDSSFERKVKELGEDLPEMKLQRLGLVGGNSIELAKNIAWNISELQESFDTYLQTQGGLG